MEELLKDLLGSTEIHNLITNLQDVFAEIGLVFCGILFAVNLAIIYLQSLTQPGGISWDSLKPGILRAVFVVAFLNAYSPLINVVDSLFFSLYNDVKEITEGGNLDEYLGQRMKLTALLEQQKTENSDDTSTAGMSPMAMIKGSIAHDATTWFHNLLCTVLGIVGIVVQLIAWAIIQVFKIIGPLAISFSILEIWKGNFLKWFNGYVASYGTMIVVLVLSIIQEGFAFVMTNQDTLNFAAVAAVDIVIIGMFLSSFKIGSYIVGEDVGSSITSNILRTVTAVSTSGGSIIQQKAKNLGGQLGKAKQKAKSLGDSIRNLTK